ncbi:hypothetical protein D9756_008762 [Leucocoprinus leucothites]|uniref:mitogen-activated protein kinase kinase kinase n=1 Tax=Leucocoprinus leucothites TaxID=201217 RepID=A0A8H5D0P7_9AGAR|nr:hypothetical protein D9756_008762 [Leucoagaricus leucothites]
MSNRANMPPYSAHEVPCTEHIQHHCSYKGFTTRSDRPERAVDSGNPHSTRVQETPQRLLERILNRSASYQTILHLERDKAQLCLETMQKVVDAPETPDSLKWLTLRTMGNLCASSGVFPRGVLLQGVQLNVGPIRNGGCGDIWKGTYQDAHVRLKTVGLGDNLKYDHRIKTFAREAILWSRLSHPNLLPFCGIYPLGNYSGQIALVSPWQEYGSIRAYLKGNPSLPRILFVYDVLDGLEYLHEHQIVHGDLKMANILITSTGSACLADYGLASIRQDTGLGQSFHQVLRGSSPAGFVAPELMEQTSKDTPCQPTFSSDVYSLGYVMYEIFTGQSLPHDPSSMEKMYSGHKLGKPSIRNSASFGSKVSNETLVILGQCWNPISKDRPTAIQVRRRLNRIHPANLAVPKLRDHHNPCPPSQFIKPRSPTLFTKTEMNLLYQYADLGHNYYAEQKTSLCIPSGNHEKESFRTPALSPSPYQTSITYIPTAPYTPRVAQASRNHTAGSASQISFKKAEFLEILVSATKKWWLAKNAEGKIGLVPSDALSLTENTARSSGFSRNTKPRVDPFIDKAKVWQSYDADNDGLPDELSIRKGELLDIAHRTGPSWLARKADGTIGRKCPLAIPRFR